MVAGSPVQVMEYFPSIHPMHVFEIFIILCAGVLIIERVLLGDFSLKRSYFWGPMAFMFVILIASWIYGMIQLQEFKIIYELHEAVLTPVLFFLLLNMFTEPGEWRVVLGLLILATIAKSIDGALIYFFSTSPSKAWGVLQNWRDGFLLALGIVASILLWHYREHKLKWLKRTMFISLPIILFTLVVSYRRTFFLAAFVGILVMFFTLEKGRKMKHFGIFLSLILVLFIIILATDPIGFLVRLFSGVANPTEEGSAYIRLMELPNILKNIRDHPIFGVPVGVEWHAYERMPLFAVFTYLGCHDTYLYWALRAGIFGITMFFWWLARLWKATILLFTVGNNDAEDKFYIQLCIQILVIYQFACFFGLLYADGFIIMDFLMVALQLMIEEKFGIISLRDIRFLPSYRERRLITCYNNEPLELQLEKF